MVCHESQVQCPNLGLPHETSVLTDLTLTQSENSDYTSGNSGNSRSPRNINNSGNYDYPPASLPRPSRFYDGQLSEQSFRERYPHTQDLIDTLSIQQNPNSVDITSSPWVRLIDNVGNADLSTDSRLSELLRIAAERTDSPEGDHDEFARSTEPARSSTRDSLHYLRSLLQSEDSRFSAEETSRALETLNQELDELGVPGWSSYNRHGGNRPESTASFRIPRPPPVDLVPPRPARRALWDQVPTDPSSMNNNTSDTHSDPSRPTTSYRSLRRRAVRPDLRSASNLTDPIAFPPLMPQSGPSSSSRDSHGRLKRRKLDSDDHREGLRGFNYGHRGQVVSGPLKMEIASCDGGTFEPEGDSSHPDNVLRNDQSVYCTKSSRCNIVLRHRGEAPFCLRKLVIKAPRTGFDSPYVACQACACHLLPT